MFRLMMIIIAIGLLIGILVAGAAMLFGFILYYVISSIVLYLSSHFLICSAWVSMGIGLVCMLAWYTYIFMMARKHFTRLLNKFLAGSEE